MSGIPKISLNLASGQTLDSSNLSVERVEELRSEVASQLKLRPGQVVFLLGGDEVADGQSLQELGEAEISVLQQPCELRPAEYQAYIDANVPGFMPVCDMRFEHGHPLIYPDGPRRGFRHDGPPGTPDRNKKPYFADKTWRLPGFAEFPEPTGININMMPFRMDDPSSLPEFVQHYWPMIEECNLPAKEKQKIGYLTIQEGMVKAGETQRRSGVHIESPGSFVQPGQYNKERYNWGCGIVNMDRSSVEGGMYIANNVPCSCKLWNVQIREPERAAGKLGDMEHMRDWLPEGVTMDPGKIYWLTDATPHESLPVGEDICRQFFRLVTSSLSAWYPEHCTENPLVEPDPAVTKIVFGSKFEGN